jgi:cobalt ECF transporter T component CbiQ
VFKIPLDVNGSTAQKTIWKKPLHRTWAVLIGIVTAISIPNSAILAMALCSILFVMLWCGIPFRFIITRLLLILPFGFFAVIFLPFTSQGEPVFHLFGFAASDEGVTNALLILLKICCANLLLTFLIATTPLFDLIKSLRTIGFPSIMIELVSLMMRYFFLLAEESRSMLRAQKSRGFSTEGLFWPRRVYRRFGQLLGMLFLRAYSRSQRIYLSMSARGGFDFAVKQVDSDEVGQSQGQSQSNKRAKVGHDPFQSSEARRNDMAIEVCGVSYHYGDQRVLRDISFTISRGSKVALMGPNGAGKSTLISLLNGLEEPSKGEVRIFGVTIDKTNRDLVRRRLGVVYQDPDDQIFSPTVEDDVAFGPKNLGLNEDDIEERVHTALGSVGVLDLRKRSPFELSYGQKRRVAIAGVLAMRPEILVLDEPMAFLDPKGRDDLQALLEGIHMMGMTVIVATHDVDFAAEWADTVVILKEGQLLRSGSTDLLFDEKLVKDADLHLPRLARPFRLLEGIGQDAKPKTVKQAAQMMWRLMMRMGSSANSGLDADAVAGGQDQQVDNRVERKL